MDSIILVSRVANITYPYRNRRRFSYPGHDFPRSMLGNRFMSFKKYGPPKPYKVRFIIYGCSCSNIFITKLAPVWSAVRYIDEYCI